MSLEEEIKKLTLAINELNRSLLISQKKTMTLNNKYLSVSEFCKYRGISKGLFYKNKHEFKIKKIGKRTFVEIN